MNRYDDSPDFDSWSATIAFSATSGNVRSDGFPVTSLPLIFGAWIQLRAYIDLDADRLGLYYGNDVLKENTSWKDGVSGGGVTVIDTLNLFSTLGASGSSGMYFDDAWLQRADRRGVILKRGAEPGAGWRAIRPDDPVAPAAWPAGDRLRLRDQRSAGVADHRRRRDRPEQQMGGERHGAAQRRESPVPCRCHGARSGRHTRGEQLRADPRRVRFVRALEPAVTCGAGACSSSRAGSRAP